MAHPPPPRTVGGMITAPSPAAAVPEADVVLRDGSTLHVRPTTAPASSAASRWAFSRSSRPSPRITRRSTPCTASSSGARNSGRRSRSELFIEPRWRSETTSVAKAL